MSSLFQDIGSLSGEAKEQLFKDRYGTVLKAAGRRSPVVEKVMALNNNTRPNPERLAVIEGIWALDLAQKYALPVKYLVVCTERIRSIEAQVLLDRYVKSAEESFHVSDRVFDHISEKGNNHGLLAVCQLMPKSFDEVYVERDAVVMILDGLEIPGNVGTILRSCDAAAVDLVIINNRKTRMNHPKLIRSSMGAVFKIPVVEADYEDTLRWLKKNQFHVVLTDTDADKTYYEAQYQGRVALVMGSEKYGISPVYYDIPHTSISIPMLGDLDSLNVGVAATIILYEAALKNKGYLKR